MGSRRGSEDKPVSPVITKPSASTVIMDAYARGRFIQVIGYAYTALRRAKRDRPAMGVIDPSRSALPVTFGPGSARVRRPPQGSTKGDSTFRQRSGRIAPGRHVTMQRRPASTWMSVSRVIRKETALRVTRPLVSVVLVRVFHFGQRYHRIRRASALLVVGCWPATRVRAWCVMPQAIPSYCRVDEALGPSAAGDAMMRRRIAPARGANCRPMRMCRKFRRTAY